MRHALRGGIAAVAVATLVGCGASMPPASAPLLGCAEPAPAPMPDAADRPCGLRQCWVNVSVQQRPYPSCERYVTVEVGKLRMAKRNQATIHWILATADPRYEFRLGGPGHEYTDGSIWFKGANAGTAPSQFSVPTLPTPKDLFMTNANTNSLTYEYGVRVFDKTPGAQHPKEADPVVINDF